MNALLLSVALAAAMHANVRVAPRGKPAKVDTVLAPNKWVEGPGQITYVTSDAVYVDRGSVDGVAVGNALTVTRAGKALGTCTVATVTEQAATCTGSGFQPGDRVGVVRKPQAKAAPLPALPDAKELAARLHTVEESPTALVDFEGGGAVAAPTGGPKFLTVVLSHTTFSNFVGRGGPYQLQRLDAQLHNVRIWKGLRASADISVLNWSQRPPGFGNPYQANTQLFVRQVEIDWRDSGGRFDLAAGRVWLRHAPGLAVMDGAQVGLHTSSGSVEGGLFGGLLPNALTLAPSTQWAAGAYGTARLSSGSGADAFFFEPEARLNWANRDLGIGTGQSGRFEIGVALHTWLGRIFDAHALAQFGLVTATAPGALDFARVDFGLHPGERLQISLGARYRGNTNGDVASLEVGAPTPGARGINADAAAMLAFNALTLGVSGMVARDLDSTLTQASVGLQAQLPTLLGHTGGVAVGFNEEIGWLPGRSAWVQLTLSPHWRFRAQARFNWFMQDSTPTTLGIAGHELGVYLAFDIRFTTFLWLRLSALGRQQLSAPPQSDTDLTGANPWRAGVSGTAALGVDL
jgi:hypothetical protein